MADRTPFVETELLVAVMEDDDDRADELVAGMTNAELLALEENARVLRNICSARRTRMGWRL